VTTGYLPVSITAMKGQTASYHQQSTIDLASFPNVTSNTHSSNGVNIRSRT